MATAEQGWKDLEAQGSDYGATRCLLYWPLTPAPTMGIPMPVTASSDERQSQKCIQLALSYRNAAETASFVEGLGCAHSLLQVPQGRSGGRLGGSQPRGPTNRTERRQLRPANHTGLIPKKSSFICAAPGLTSCHAQVFQQRAALGCSKVFSKPQALAGRRS